MSHLCPVSEVQSSVVFDPIIQDDFSAKVARWKQLLSICYGPRGRQLMIQNTLGGHVCLTSSCDQIINCVRTSNPVTNVLLASVKGHCKAYGDFGLFCALLGLCLTGSPVMSELPMSLVAHIRNNIFEIVTEHLISGCRHCKLKVNVQNLKQLLSIVTAILKTKTACVLSYQEIQYIATVVMQGFLTTIPSESSVNSQQIKYGKVHFVSLEGLSPLNSKHFSGLLIPLVPSGHNNVCQFGPNKRIVLLDVSLAGDTAEAPAADFMFAQSSSSLIEDDLLLQLLILGDELIRLRIDVLACQKVVHPRLAKMLQKKGILILDRLGLATFSLVCEVTGGKPVSCINNDICETQLGQVEIEAVNMYGKQYLCFKQTNLLVSSILLCHVQEECLVELQRACQQSLLSLKSLLSSPEAFVGAGCLEIHLANVVQSKIINCVEDIATSKEGSRLVTAAQVAIVAEDFTKTLLSLGKALHPNCDKFCTDVEFGHLWASRTNLGLDETCACGLVTSEMLCSDLLEINVKPLPTFPLEERKKELVFMEGSVLDIAVPKEAAYRCAFEISLVLLQVGLIIVNAN